MTAASFLAAGAFLAGLGVAAGAFGSHWLGQRLSPQRLNQYEIGVRYQLVHALALILCGLAMRLWRRVSTWCNSQPLCFFKIEYSLYTLWQSVRRVWRLGQTQPVKAIFSVYTSAMEATALVLIGRKMKAAQLVYGDEVGGVIVPEEEGDFLT